MIAFWPSVENSGESIGCVLKGQGTGNFDIGLFMEEHPVIG
jgi:hypothetical protein